MGLFSKKGKKNTKSDIGASDNLRSESSDGKEGKKLKSKLAFLKPKKRRGGTRSEKESETGGSPKRRKIADIVQPTLFLVPGLNIDEKPHHTRQHDRRIAREEEAFRKWADKYDRKIAREEAKALRSKERTEKLWLTVKKAVPGMKKRMAEIEKESQEELEATLRYYERWYPEFRKTYAMCERKYLAREEANALRSKERVKRMRARENKERSKKFFQDCQAYLREYRKKAETGEEKNH